MKMQIRQNCYETNSSSCHTITIKTGEDRGKLEPFNIKTNSKGQVACTFTDCSRSMCVLLTTQRQKLSYLLTYVANTEVYDKVLSANDDPVEEFIDTEGFGLINTFLKQHCNGINIDGIEGLTLEKDYDDGGYHIECEYDLDHNSNYGSLKEWLYHHNITIEQFILNPNVSISDLGECSLPDREEEWYEDTN